MDNKLKANKVTNLPLKKNTNWNFTIMCLLLA